MEEIDYIKYLNSKEVRQHFLLRPKQEQMSSLSYLEFDYDRYLISKHEHFLDTYKMSEYLAQNNMTWEELSALLGEEDVMATRAYWLYSYEMPKDKRDFLLERGFPHYYLPKEQRVYTRKKYRKIIKEF